MAVFGGSTLVLIGIGTAARIGSRPVSYYTRDPVTSVAVNDASCSASDCSYLGVLSNLGVILLAATTALCLAAAFIAARSWPSCFRPFLFAGALTAVLTADDLFVLHEGVFYFSLGLHQRVVFAAYGLALVLYAVVFRDFVRGTDFPVLLAALCLFAVSILNDQQFPGHHFFEDGSKFLGIVGWSTYFAGTALGFLQQVVPHSGAGHSIQRQLDRPESTGVPFTERNAQL